VKGKVVELRLRDGATAASRLFTASGPGPGLLVLPAMGVNARAYDRLAEGLASVGVTTLVAEHRGGDGSSVRPRRGVDFGYAELLEDMELHFAELRKHVTGPMHLLGHSLGGQLGTVGLARWFELGGKLIVIASGTVHHRAWGGVRGVGVLIGTQLAHVVARGLGYFPGHRLGFGGLQSRTLIVDWANAARTGEFHSHTQGPLEHRLDELAPDVLALHVQGDTMAPRFATEALLRKLKHARVQWADVTPPAQPSKMNAHFRWLKDPSEVVERVSRFLLSA
jgi:predicted alpha/beta hydrolase